MEILLRNRLEGRQKSKTKQRQKGNGVGNKKVRMKSVRQSRESMSGDEDGIAPKELYRAPLTQMW